MSKASSVRPIECQTAVLASWCASSVHLNSTNWADWLEVPDNRDAIDAIVSSIENQLTQLRPEAALKLAGQTRSGPCLHQRESKPFWPFLLRPAADITCTTAWGADPHSGPSGLPSSGKPTYATHALPMP